MPDGPMPPAPVALKPPVCDRCGELQSAHTAIKSTDALGAPVTVLICPGSVFQPAK